MPDDTQHAYTVEDAAALLGTSPDAIRKRLRRGSLQGEKGQGGAWVVYLQQDTEQATQDKPRRETARAIRRDGTSQTSHEKGAQAWEEEKAALLQKVATLTEALDDARRERDDWKAQAQQALQALTNQQALSLPGAMKDMPALGHEGGKGTWWGRLRDAMTRRR